MANNPLLDQLTAAIDSQDTAHRVKQFVDSYRSDPAKLQALSPQDRAELGLIEQSIKRWVNPAPVGETATIYNSPRAPGDVIERQTARGPISGRVITNTDATLVEHLGHGLSATARAVGLPGSLDEAGDRFNQWASRPKGNNAAEYITDIGRKLAPFYPDVTTFASIPGLPMAVTKGVKDVIKPISNLASGRITSKEEALAATGAGTTAMVTLYGLKGPASRAKMGGYNKILDPERTVRLQTKRVNKKLNERKLVRTTFSDIDQNTTADTVHFGRDLADKTRILAEDMQTAINAETNAQKRAWRAIDDADLVENTANKAIKMMKREKVYNASAPNMVTRRISEWIPDAEERLLRGDDFGKILYDKYRDTGIPRNPAKLTADKLDVHERTQQRLSQPDMVERVVDEETVINAVMKDVLGKAKSVVGDNRNFDPHLNDIVQRSVKNGRITLADYQTLLDMVDGKYVKALDADGAPVPGKVSMPDMLLETISYLERLRTEGNGKLPSNPFELNNAKAMRHTEIDKSTFGKDMTEADRSRASVQRAQAAGLRRLVKELTDDGTGHSQIDELNAEYGALAVAEDAAKRYNVGDKTAPPLPPMGMTNGSASLSVSGGARAVTGTGLWSGLTRWSRHMLKSPQAGVTFGKVTEGIGRLRGLQPPPKRPGAGPPKATGPAQPPTPGFATPRPVPPPQATPKTKGQGKGKTGAVGVSSKVSVGQQPIDAVTGPPLENLVTTALTYARGGNLNKLAKLWKDHGEQLSPLLSKANRKWINEKLSTHAKNKARRMAERAAKGKEADVPAQETTETSVGTATAPPKPKGKRARKAAREANAPKPEFTTTPVVTPDYGDVDVADPLGMGSSSGGDITPGTKGKGAFVKGRTVEEANNALKEEGKRASEVIPDKPTGQVATEAFDYSHYSATELDKAIADSNLLKASATAKGKTELAKRQDDLIAAAQAMKARRAAGEVPTYDHLSAEVIMERQRKARNAKEAASRLKNKTEAKAGMAEQDAVLSALDAALSKKQAQINPLDAPVDPVEAGKKILEETDAELAEVDPEFVKGTNGPPPADAPKKSRTRTASAVKGPPVTMESAKTVSTQLQEAISAGDTKKAAKLQKQLDKILSALEKQ